MKTFKLASFTAAILLSGAQLAALITLFITAPLQSGSTQYGEATLSTASLPPVLVVGTRAE
jgi:hypothetical protein